MSTDDKLADVIRSESSDDAYDALLGAARLVVGLAAVWQADPFKSTNTMNVGFMQLQEAIQRVEAAKA